VAPSSRPPTAAPVAALPTLSPVVSPISAAPSSVAGPPTAAPVAVVPTPSTAAPVAAPTSAAPTAPIVHDGFEYAFVHGQQNWEDHEDRAVAWGGHLASVHSAEEYDFLLGLRDPTRKYFLGGGRLPGQDAGGGNETWEWSDGSPWDYTAWAEGEPSNTNGREDRVGMLKDGPNPKKNNRWNDFASTDRKAAIYKRRSATPAAPSSSPPTGAPVAALSRPPTAAAAAPSSRPPTAAPVAALPTLSPVALPTPAAPSSVVGSPTAAPVAAVPAPSTVTPASSSRPSYKTGTKSATDTGNSDLLEFFYLLLALLVGASIIYWRGFLVEGCKKIALCWCYPKEDTHEDDGEEEGALQTPLL